MGITYSTAIAVGWRISHDLLDDFYSETEVEFHWEDRFDPKTGQKIAPVKVIDQPAYGMYKLQTDSLDIETEDEDEFLEAVADHLEINNMIMGSFPTGELVNVLSVKMPEEIDTGLDEYKFSTCGSYLFRDITNLASKLTEVASQLHELGIKVGEPELLLVWTAG